MQDIKARWLAFYAEHLEQACTQIFRSSLFAGSSRRSRRQCGPPADHALNSATYCAANWPSTSLQAGDSEAAWLARHWMTRPPPT
jgi:hypothetical protein